MQNPPKKLLDKVRDAIRLKHYSYRTEETYVQWIVRYILFHNKRHPKDMGVPEIEEFLTHLAVKGNVAATTQNQALNAILFLYRQVLQIELAERINATYSKPISILDMAARRNAMNISKISLWNILFCLLFSRQRSINHR
jgi:Phage integrase, N-terminal SAM-like domain